MRSRLPSLTDYPHTVTGTPTVFMQRVEVWLAQLAEHRAEPLATEILSIAAQWPQAVDRAILAEAAPTVWSRGDPNLANCLWDGTRVRCIDLEYSGWSDLAFDLADLIEAQPSRCLSDAAWSRFVARFDLASAAQQRLRSARRLCAVFWIMLLWQRRSSGDQARQRLIAQIRRVREMLKQC